MFGWGVPRRIRIGNVQKDVWMGGSETYKDWECSEMRVTGGGCQTCKDWECSEIRLTGGGFHQGVQFGGSPNIDLEMRGSIRGFSLGVPQN